VITRELGVRVKARDVPAVAWWPDGPRRRRPLVLIGHGGSQHKTHPGVVELATRFVEDHGFAVAAIDGPIHGARRATPLTGAAMQAEFLELWPRDDRIATMVEDWRAALDVLAEEIAPTAVGWYGVSMGTAYGLPLIAIERRVAAAVLGMWGLGFVNSEQLGLAARSVECPVLFQQKWDDHLFTREGQLQLFDRLGTTQKWLKVYPGGHVPVAGEQADDAVQFLASRLATASDPA
jgi:alpha-beta hydrolase superfamily lysophospholipase